MRDLPPTLNIYGVYCAELMFFESPAAGEVPEDTLSLTTGIVRATQGEVTEAQIVRRLQELAPGDLDGIWCSSRTWFLRLISLLWMTCRDC